LVAKIANAIFPTTIAATAISMTARRVINLPVDTTKGITIDFAMTGHHEPRA
jgi:hypothetical protein